MPKWLNPPNTLTLIRLGLVPVIIHRVLAGRHLVALELFAAAAVTDILDGTLARRFGWRTRAGAYLDPIADKALLSGIFLAMAAAGSIPAWFVVVIFGRDLFILFSSGIALAFTRLRQFPPTVWGKASTFLQILTAVAWLARTIPATSAAGTAADLLLWPTAAVTIWSAVHYGWRGLRLVRMH